MAQAPIPSGSLLENRPLSVSADAGVELKPSTVDELGAWFERIYSDACGDATRIRWADCRANRMLVQWLNERAPGIVRPGCRSCVIGCGLGDDCAELAGRGYDVTAFDISPSAVAWARARFPELSGAFIVSDACHPPGKHVHRFDFVAEVYTIQSVPPAMRLELARGIARIVSPRGILVVVCRGREEGVPLSDDAGPPWPLTPTELTTLMAEAGLCPLEAVEQLIDPEEPEVMRLRGVFAPR